MLSVRAQNYLTLEVGMVGRRYIRKYLTITDVSDLGQDCWRLLCPSTYKKGG